VKFVSNIRKSIPCSECQVSKPPVVYFADHDRWLLDDFDSFIHAGTLLDESKILGTRSRYRLNNEVERRREDFAGMQKDSVPPGLGGAHGRA
jgi:hypothetical protein